MTDSLQAQPLRILVIDDLPSIHDDFRKVLQPPAPARSVLDKASVLFGTSAGPLPGSKRFDLDSAHQGSEGLALLEQALEAGRPYALAFVDMRMPPGWDGLETVRRLWQADPRLQVVICTAHSDYTWTDFNAALGPSDKLIILKKPFDNIEVQQLAHALTGKWLLARELEARIACLDEQVRQRTAELTRANEELSASDTRYRMTLAAAQQGLFELNVQTREIRTTPEYARILGREPDGFVESHQDWLARMPEEDRARVELEYAAYIAGASSFFSLEYRQTTASGALRWILMRGNAVSRCPEGHPRVIMGTITDITERHLEEQRQQRSQRLECIGSLASGIAHDINNALVPQVSGVPMLRPHLPADKHEVLDLMALSAERISSMVMQLVHFARGADGRRLPVSPKSLLEEVRRFISSTFPKNIACRFNCSCPTTVLVGDPTQLHQILINLCLNARDAMPEGGVLIVDLSRVEVGAETAARFPGAGAGPHVCIEVRDTGTGIPEGIRERIFDPFFTTKGPDKGSGLGLATVLGITKGHSGFIDVESERGKGSCFQVFLPVAPLPAGTAENESPALPVHDVAPHQNLVLLVDDEAPIRTLAPLMFKDSPFRVQTAANASEALVSLAAHGMELALLVVDISMPSVDGVSLVHNVRQLRPELPVIAMSGNFGRQALAELRTLGVHHYLPKPFDRQALFTKIFAACRT